MKMYKSPTLKQYEISSDRIMGIVAVSDGYEQGVSGDGTNDEGRSNFSIF